MSLSTYEAQCVRTMMDYLAGIAGVPRRNVAGLAQPTPPDIEAVNCLAALANAADKTIHDTWQPHDVRRVWPAIRDKLVKP